MTPAGSRTGAAGWALAAAMLLAGCTQGDFGRPRPGVIQDVVAPAIGAVLAERRGEPVSALPFTENEQELRSRAVVLTRPADPRDRVAASQVEAERWRLAPPGISLPRASLPGPVVGASTAARWNWLLGQIITDRDLIGPFLATADRVQAADQYRLEAARRNHVGPGVYAAVAARVAENREIILWVEQATAVRFAAFEEMAGRLDAEAPDPAAALAVWDALAEIRLVVAGSAAGGPAGPVGWGK